MSDDSAAKAIKATAPTLFANYSNGALADAMGDIDTQIELLQVRQKAARAEMTRRHANALEGARFFVSKAVVDTHTFDGKAVRAEMGDAWYEARQKPGTRTTYTVMLKAPEELGVPS